MTEEEYQRLVIEKIIRGEEAKKILDNPLIKEAVASIRGHCLQGMLGARNDKKIKEFRNLLACVNLFEQFFVELITEKENIQMQRAKEAEIQKLEAMIIEQEKYFDIVRGVGRNIF